jgi:hypothetical protein
VKFRELFKQVISGYSKFAKTAKASELVPYTAEWSEMSDSEKAEIIFGKHTAGAADRFRRLPKTIREFAPSNSIDEVESDALVCDKLLAKLDDQVKYARHILAVRDRAGTGLEEDVLKALNPKAFALEGRKTALKAIASPLRKPKTTKLWLEVRRSHLRRFRDFFVTKDDRVALASAVALAAKAIKRGVFRRKNH